MSELIGVEGQSNKESEVYETSEQSERGVNPNRTMLLLIVFEIVASVYFERFLHVKQLCPRTSC